MAAAVFGPGPSSKERAAAKAWGMEDDEIDGPPVQVWPENEQVVSVFLCMRTQWRTGMGGPTGMDYSALPFMWQRLRVPPEEQDAVFADLQVMEVAALNAAHADRGESENV